MNGILIKFIPGENVRMMIIAAYIRVMTGISIIIFRTVVEGIETCFLKVGRNGYGFTKFLRKVNLEGGYIRARTIFLKLTSTAVTIGPGNSTGVEGPVAPGGLPEYSTPL